jgi:integrase
MPQIRFTEKSIDKLKAPDPSGRQTLHWDSDLKGFAVLCSGISNTRTYVVQRDMPNGKTRRVTVGAVNEIALDVARVRAADMLDDLRRGIDPKEKKEVEATLRKALDDYLIAGKNLRPASVKAYRTGVESYLTAWLDTPLREITSEMVATRHLAIATEIGKKGERYKGTTTANCAMRAFRVVYNFEADRIAAKPGTLPLPPWPKRRLEKQWHPEPPRERMVKAEELPKFYEAVCALPNAVARDHILLMLFTGLRLTESASLKWDAVDLNQRVIRLPASSTKAKRKLDLPMSDFVRDLLVARRSLGNATFVFPGPAGHITDASHPLNAVAEATGIKVSAHDLRRTFITVAALSSDISPTALKALVNHSLGGGITERYIQMTVDQLREPVQKVCDKMKMLCGIVPPAGENVSKLLG